MDRLNLKNQTAMENDSSNNAAQDAPLPRGKALAASAGAGPAFTSSAMAAAIPWERTAALVPVLPCQGESQYRLSDKVTVIGRDTSASISLDDPLVSQKAAHIERRDSRYFVSPGCEDASLQVNGTAVFTRRELAEGDILELPGFKARFTYLD